MTQLGESELAAGGIEFEILGGVERWFLGAPKFSPAPRATGRIPAASIYQGADPPVPNDN